MTSYSQFERKVTSHFNVSSVSFYIHDRNQNSKNICNNRQLKAAVSYLDHGDVLGVNAYAGYAYGNYYKEDSDSESEQEHSDSDSDSDSSDEEESNYDYSHYSNSTRAVLKRFTHSSTCQYGLPWDGDAPSAPLYQRSDYAVMDEVTHLQYLLTRLGFMKLSDTSAQVGSYQSRTQEAVRRFRQHYGIYGSDMTRYNRKTAAKLASVVRECRRQGYEHL